MTNMEDVRNPLQSVVLTNPETEDDPILGLVGLGEEVWRQLGGGEKILAWLRSDDPEPRPPWDDRQAVSE
jgi:hypothetical protein